MPNKDDPSNWLEELFGPVIYSYPDSQAIEDGILIPFITAQSRDTKHRMTSNAFGELKEHYKKKGYSDYTEKQFYDFFFDEFLILAPSAVQEHSRGEILQTDFDFKVGKYGTDKPDRLWYLPNEVGGVTMLKPEDY